MALTHSEHLSEKLLNHFTDMNVREEISEEVMESLMDEVQFDADLERLKRMCRRFDLSTKWK
jgi:hypothetical protein